LALKNFSRGGKIVANRFASPSAILINMSLLLVVGHSSKFLFKKGDIDRVVGDKFATSFLFEGAIVWPAMTRRLGIGSAN
jgi:hypothetical protein